MRGNLEWGRVISVPCRFSIRAQDWNWGPDSGRQRCLMLLNWLAADSMWCLHPRWSKYGFIYPISTASPASLSPNPYELQSYHCWSYRKLLAGLDVDGQWYIDRPATAWICLLYPALGPFQKNTSNSFRFSHSKIHQWIAPVNLHPCWPKYTIVCPNHQPLIQEVITSPVFLSSKPHEAQAFRYHGSPRVS